MKPVLLRKRETLYQNDDRVKSIYFLTSGKASYVLPPFNNAPYIQIKAGDSLGVIDIIGSIQSLGLDDHNNLCRDHHHDKEDHPEEVCMWYH